MGQLRGHNESVITNQSSARSSNSFLAIGGEGQLGGASMPPIEGPFRLTMAHDEHSRGSHRYYSATNRLKSNGSLLLGLFRVRDGTETRSWSDRRCQAETSIVAARVSGTNFVGQSPYLRELGGSNSK